MITAGLPRNILRAPEAKALHHVAGPEARSHGVPEKSGIISGIARLRRSTSAEKGIVETGIAP